MSQIRRTAIAAGLARLARDMVELPYNAPPLRYWPRPLPDHTKAINFYDALREYVGQLREERAAASHHNIDECALCGPTGSASSTTSASNAVT